MIKLALSKEEKERRKIERQQKKWDSTHKIIDGVDHKFCSECKDFFPATEDFFHRNKSNGIDGLYTYCKQCSIKKSEENRAENYDRYRAYQREYYRNNEEYRQASIEVSTRRRKAGYSKEWQRKNPDKLKEYVDKRKHKAHKITKKEWESCKEYFDYSCAYCGMSEDEAKEKYNNYLHKEHVVHDGSSDISNCVPSCKGCNSSKGSLSLDEWYVESNNKTIFSKKRLLKINKWLNKDYLKCIQFKKKS